MIKFAYEKVLSWLTFDPYTNVEVSGFTILMIFIGTASLLISGVIWITGMKPW